MSQRAREKQEAVEIRERLQAMQREINDLDSQHPFFWRPEFGEKYGLVEPERAEWKSRQEYDDLKLEYVYKTSSVGRLGHCNKVLFRCETLEQNIAWKNNYKQTMGHDPDDWRYLSPVKLTKLAFRGLDNGYWGAVNARPRNDSRVEWMIYRGYLLTIDELTKRKD